MNYQDLACRTRKLQNCSVWALAIIGCARQGICHGFIRGSGISGVSMAIRFTSAAFRSIEFIDCSLCVSSWICARRTALSDSNSMYCCVTAWICIEIWAFWLLISSSSLISSFKCCCFLILDRLADSLLESIRFRFRSSITGCESPSELEDRREGKQDIDPFLNTTVI